MLLDLGLAALQRVAQLPVDRLQLGEPAAVEDQRQGAEELLDLDVAVGALERDARVVAEAALRLLVARRGQLDVLLAQQGGLLDHRHRVGRQVDVAVDRERDHRGPVVRQLDLVDPAHRHVGDPDAGLRHQVEDVEELHLDRVRVVAGVGAARQAEGVGAAEPAAGEQQDAGSASGARPASARRLTGHPGTGGRPATACRPAPPRPPPPSSACSSSCSRGCRCR